MKEVLLFALGCPQILTGTLHTHFGCFGTSDYSFMDANCSAGSVVYPFNYYYGSKLQTLNCLEETNENTTLGDAQTCCTLDTATDCYGALATSTGGSASNYYGSCIGKETCTKLQAGRDSTLKFCSNITAHMDYTHYMVLDYYCIESTHVHFYCFGKINPDL